MIPSVVGILVAATGLYLIYVGVHGGPGDTLRVNAPTDYGVAPSKVQPT